MREAPEKSVTSVTNGKLQNSKFLTDVKMSELADNLPTFDINEVDTLGEI